MFKKIYYINLENRKDRREHVENEIKKINFNGPIERVNAAYGKNLDLKLIPSNLFTKEAINSTTNKKDISNTKTMTKGGMGVALSQKWVYEKILCGEEDYALILEDDVTIPNNFMTKLEETLKKVKYFDMLCLGYHIKYAVLNTCKLTGIPQNRERIYIVCFKDKSAYDSFTFDFPEKELLPEYQFLEKNIP